MSAHPDKQYEKVKEAAKESFEEYLEFLERNSDLVKAAGVDITTFFDDDTPKGKAFRNLIYLFYTSGYIARARDRDQLINPNN